MTNPLKDKGSRFEHDVVDYLRAHGYTRADRTLAGQRDDMGDISNVPLIIQCKNQREFRLAEWVDQAEQQALNAGETRFVVVLKRPRVADVARAYAVMPFWLAAELMTDVS